MIKKMLAMLVAISCAFGAWADTPNHISGTDFSALSEFVLGLDDSGQATDSTFWYNGAPSDFEGTIVTDGVGKFLDFESNITNPLYRTVNDCYDAASVSALPKRSIGTGLFIDTYVQFTPYLVNENHPAPSAVTDDDKLIVWVREIEVENDANLTNLIVTAGYYNNFDEVSESNYVVTNLSPAEIATLCSTTNRLTIKSFSSITGEDDAPAGFVVYINKKSLEYAADAFSGGSYVGNLDTTPAAYYEPGRHRLFPSLMAGDQTNHDKLSGVGYAGMGKIGEVWFDDYSTDYPDFAGDDHNITIVKGEGVVSYVYNNITYTEDYSTAVSVPTVTISNVVYNTSAGYQHKTGTWYIGSQVVNNTSTADGDIGTFDLANGNRLVLAGFKANYLVGGFEYQSLFGIEPTETTGAYNAAKSGGTIKLNKDILIDEGTHKQIVVGEDDDLTIDLNGHTLQGTAEDDYTIVNNLGTLTIIDTSDGQTGKVLGCLTFDGADWVNNFQAIKSTGEYVVSNALTAGTYELILTDVNADKFVISAGSYICPFEDEDHHEIQPSAFYLASYLAPGATVTSWTQDPVTEFWYANVSSSGPTPPQESYFPQTDIVDPLSPYYGRTGTAASPFVIRNEDDFEGLWNDIADGYNTDKCFEVVSNNITLTDWVGIGTNSSTYAFAGTLNGGGKTVNVTFAENKKYNGLFCFVNNATISNLTVNVTAGTISGETAGAAFVGKAYGSCTFETLKATGSLGASGNPVNHNTGGICAQVNGSGTMNFNSCTNAMNIYARYKKVGGILATREVSDTAQINFNSCVNTGNITNSYGVHADCNGTGGLMGWTGYANPANITIANCSNTGNIASPDMYPGNYVGYVSAAPTASGVNIGLASLKPSGNGADPTSCISGLNWATVSGDIATFVTPVATVDSVVAYKVMQAASTPNFTLAAAAASLTIDTSLAAYTGTVSVDSTLSEDYNLRETAIANGTIYSLVSKTPADPWAPTAETDEAAAAKIADLFPGTEVAANVTTYAMYTNLVDYIKGVTSSTEEPDDITDAQEPWLWKSYILGANPLFVTNAVVAITSLDVGENAGEWDFIVKVTEGELTTAHSVAAAKVAALVKVTDSLSPASWSAPDPDDVHADLAPLLGTNLIKVTVDFGTDTSGFMKVSE